jgi:hypothetical protein
LSRIDNISNAGYKDYMDNNDSFEKILKSARLSTKQYQFFENLVSPQSETCGDIVSSYNAAGYAVSETSKYYAYRVYNSPKFQKVLTAYRENSLKREKNREFTILERTTEDLNYIINKTRIGGDMSTMRQAVMDRAKLHGLLVERHQVIDPVTEDKVSKAKELEAARIAESHLLGEPVECPVDMIDAAFEPVNNDNCPAEPSSEDIESAFLDQKCSMTAD